MESDSPSFPTNTNTSFYSDGLGEMKLETCVLFFEREKYWETFLARRTSPEILKMGIAWSML